MNWEARQTRRFARAYKKLHDNVATDVDEAVQTITTNPDIGERKKGDLSQLFAYKFRSQNQLYLLGYVQEVRYSGIAGANAGYTRDDSVRLIYLESVGPHENFYRDLKR